MSTKKIRFKDNFEQVIERTRFVFGVKTDIELAQLFDLKPNNFNSRKMKATLLDEVVVFTLKYHPEINLHWLLTGDGEIYRQHTPAQQDNVINLSHQDLVTKFKNPAMAEHINRKLLEIEDMDESKMEYVKGVVDTLHAVLAPMKKKTV
jgi:hypothetical protein